MDTSGAGPPATDESGRLGPLAGLATGLCWTAMLAILLRLPDLDDPAQVVDYWARLGSLTQLVIAAVVVGYPFLLVFLTDLRRRWVTPSASARVVADASYAGGLMFLTALNVALGLASAGGQLIGTGDRQLGYALHVAAFVLAAPATALGTMLCAGLSYATATGGLRPRWLRWPAGAALVANAATLGGLFTLTGPWNSGNGLLGGIALPLGTVTVFVVTASAAWLRADTRPAGAD